MTPIQGNNVGTHESSPTCMPQYGNLIHHLRVELILTRETRPNCGELEPFTGGMICVFCTIPRPAVERIWHKYESKGQSRPDFGLGLQATVPKMRTSMMRMTQGSSGNLDPQALTLNVTLATDQGGRNTWPRPVFRNPESRVT